MTIAEETIRDLRDELERTHRFGRRDELRQQRNSLEADLDALLKEHRAVCAQLETTKAELATAREDFDAALRDISDDLEATKGELEEALSAVSANPPHRDWLWSYGSYPRCVHE